MAKLTKKEKKAKEREMKEAEKGHQHESPMDMGELSKK
jgi:hypothetical protein